VTKRVVTSGTSQRAEGGLRPSAGILSHGLANHTSRLDPAFTCLAARKPAHRWAHPRSRWHPHAAGAINARIGVPAQSPMMARHMCGRGRTTLENQDVPQVGSSVVVSILQFCEIARIRSWLPILISMCLNPPGKSKS
jgi:hypothetical protein